MTSDWAAVLLRLSALCTGQEVQEAWREARDDVGLCILSRR